MRIIKLKPLNFTHSKIYSVSSLQNSFGRIFLCCDDQYDLYELFNGNWVTHHWSSAPILPIDHVALKKIKPDFEAILETVDNNLIMVPSGSKNNRTQALMLNLNTNIFKPLDMSDFFKDLAKTIKEINIEGAQKIGEDYLFLNRGVAKNKSSLIVVKSHNLEIKKIKELEFDEIKNIPLHGSELCIFDNHLYALAVAEDSANSYNDAMIIGSGLFKISLDNFNIIDNWIFDLPIKAEGLCRWEDKWLVVTDPDGAGQSEFFTF